MELMVIMNYDESMQPTKWLQLHYRPNRNDADPTISTISVYPRSSAVNIQSLTFAVNL
ncbi:MAG: hypothetical protein LKM36_01870 [Flavobacteriales bacterium]|jgi:hypothetical protein|nr:hypothetical protein [Flavobacteriales bacterium]